MLTTATTTATTYIEAFAEAPDGAAHGGQAGETGRRSGTTRNGKEAPGDGDEGVVQVEIVTLDRVLEPFDTVHLLGNLGLRVWHLLRLLLQPVPLFF